MPYLYKSRLKEYGRPQSVITGPNLNDQEENRIRKQILHSYRGKDRVFSSEQTGKASLSKLEGEPLLASLPEDIHWFRAVLTQNELGKVKYVDYPYWNELSNWSRLPRVAAENILAGREIDEESKDRYFKISKKLKLKQPMADLILLAAGSDDPLVLLEGHARLTAYFLGDDLPENTTVIVGFSELIREWRFY